MPPLAPPSSHRPSFVEPPSPQIGRRYQLGALLGRGGMGEVWQVRDRLTGKDVACKRIRPARLRVRPEAATETLRLTQEFRLLASLHHPNIIAVQDYGFDRQGWPYFTMRLLPQATTLTAAAAKLDRDGKVHLLIQLFHGLAYLHRRGVLHRDLKPSNVMVTGDRLHIVDFGLSVTLSEATQVESLAGTLHYLAPELLEGAVPSERSDLYTAGMLVYEVLTGKHPFRTSSRNALEQAIRSGQADFEDANLIPAVVPLLRQLLAKDPAERPQDHSAIIAVLTGLASSAPAAPAQPDERDGLRRAAPLVGRDRELGEMVLDLVAAGQGHGRSRAVLGMVGSGKTRLVEELRSIALVRGLLVIDGQCSAEGGQPFAPWRQALRLLVLEQDISDTTAAVLKPLIGDLDQLIGRPVAMPPELDPGGTLARLVGVITALLQGIGRPVLVAIEDLHWAGPESLDLFALLAQTAIELPVFLLGTARAEEAPGIAEHLAAATVTDLQPLERPALEELAAGTIGPAGRSRALVELLVRESEGNPFFAVELLRAVVIRAGGWDQVESMPLPDRMFVDGMRSVVAGRLERLLPADRELAELASLTGRELDVDLLRQLAPTAEWTGFFQRAAGQGLVDIRAGRWSFMHDQLRVALQEGIPTERRRRLHRRIADAGRGSAPELAFHWRQAGDTTQEALWSIRSGREALTVGAYRHALDSLERALELQRLFAGVVSAEELPQLHFLAGDAAFRAGDLPRAFHHLSTVLAQARASLPVSLAHRVPVLAVQGLVQVAHRLPGGSVAWFTSRRARERAVLLARTWELLSRLCIYSGDGLGVLLCALRASNLSDNTDRAQIYAHGILGVAAATAGRWKLADGYFRRIEAMAAVTGDQLGLIDAQVMEGVSYLGSGRFEEAMTRLRRARSGAERISYRLGQGQALTLEAVCHGYGGDLTRMHDINREALETIRLHSHGHQPGFRCGLAQALIQLGRFAEARATLEQARRQAASDDRLAQALVAAGLITLHLREGNLDAAQQEDERLETVLQGVTAIPSPCAQLVEAPAELLIARWHLALQHGDPVIELQRRARRRLGILQGWARIYPIGRPFLWWFRGHQQFLLARQREAWAAWEQGRIQAVELGMPVYEAILSMTLAKHGPRPQQRNHRFRARALFVSSHALWHARQFTGDDSDDDSGSRLMALMPDVESGTHTAAYNVATRRQER
jgi:tetratricopeptide (TPR) repeat protein/tRNA A-37 threonylcarbamoyl transferase component Bud32